VEWVLVSGATSRMTMMMLVMVVVLVHMMRINEMLTGRPPALSLTVDQRVTAWI
jgi:hypothetical protein